MRKISYEEFEELLERHDSFDFCEANLDYYQRVVLVDKTVYVEDEAEDIAHVCIFRREVEAEHFFKTLQYLSRVLGQDKTLPTDILEELYRNSDVAEDAVYLYELFIKALLKETGCEHVWELGMRSYFDADTLNAAERIAIIRAKQNPAFFDSDATYELFETLKDIMPFLKVWEVEA